MRPFNEAFHSHLRFVGPRLGQILESRYKGSPLARFHSVFQEKIWPVYQINLFPSRQRRRTALLNSSSRK